MSICNKTPIIVGVGQVTEQVPADLTSCSSHADLAGEASRRAMSDALNDSLAEHIDTIACVRTFADSLSSISTSASTTTVVGFNNFPRSVGNRIGANPSSAVYEVAGGHSPQKLVGEFFEKLNAGECDMVLLAGGEAMANIKVASKNKVQLDWREEVAGQLDDRGVFDGSHLITRMEFELNLMQPVQFYGLMEQARRGEKGLGADGYNQQMANCFSKLSRVAADNPYAMNTKSYEAEELITVTDNNKMVCSPYPKNLIAKDGVNQGAALLLTTVGKAKELGIAEEKWTYLHGYANTKDRVILKREKIGRSRALEFALKGGLEAAGKTSADIDHFDIYSCFPIVVAEACDVMGIEENDPRSLTQTGGLAYFGGPGNNYTMHGIASLVETLRKDPGSFGMASGNGGWMSKHSVGVYSTAAPEGGWASCDSSMLQMVLDKIPEVEVEHSPQGEAVLEAYIINYVKGNPFNSVIIGRLKGSNRRFYATNPFLDSDTLQQTLKGDCLGQKIFVEADPKGNRYAYSEPRLLEFSPKKVEEFQDSYEFCKVARNGHILTVTINRPETRNALHPPANQELENVFNAFEKDKDLWVAILTGEGDASFSAGNDLKYMALGGEVWVPKTGFAGITSRTDRTKPIIAAVNGVALGGGLEIAMAADIIVAVEHAHFGLPEVKVGLFAGAGGVQRLTRQIGRKKAVEMIITGEPITPQEALDAGLINYVVPADQLMKKAEAIALKITEASPMAVSSSLQLLNESSRFASEDDAVTFSHTVFDNLLNSDDFFEGSMAFAQKRKPRWIGK